jgi:hypothetical protein
MIGSRTSQLAVAKSEKLPPRTKHVIANDVAYILNAPLHRKAKRIVVKNAAWAWTTTNGKYKGCPYWTQAAIDLSNASGGKRRPKGLNHEHAVPIEALFRILDSLPKPVTPELAYECLEKCLIGVVVTTAEHATLNERFKKSMPEGFDYSTGSVLARYEACRIKIVECSAES